MIADLLMDDEDLLRLWGTHYLWQSWCYQGRL